VRALGRFLDDPLDVLWAAVELLAGQLEIGDASCVKKYVQRPQTAYGRAWEIRTRYGYPPLQDAEVAERWSFPGRPGMDACRRSGRLVRPVGGLAAP
jgi:hypothetical protein